MRKNAFTLAEVLVTLGIIGVISALTLPTLVKSHQKQELVTRLSKVYSVLSQGIDMMMTEEKAINFSETSLASVCNGENGNCATVFRRYFNISSSEYIAYGRDVKNNLDCSYDSATSEYYSCYKSANTSSEYVEGTRFLLNDGAMVYVSTDTTNRRMMFGVDVNGEEGPNIVGRDVFQFSTDFSGNGHLQASDSYSRQIIKNGWKMNY